MTKSELMAEFGKVELMLDEVSDLINGEHHGAAQLSVKRMSLVIGNFKEKLQAFGEQPKPEAKPAAAPPVK